MTVKNDDKKKKPTSGVVGKAAGKSGQDKPPLIEALCKHDPLFKRAMDGDNAAFEEIIRAALQSESVEMSDVESLNPEQRAVIMSIYEQRVAQFDIIAHCEDIGGGIPLSLLDGREKMTEGDMLPPDEEQVLNAISVLNLDFAQNLEIILSKIAELSPFESVSEAAEEKLKLLKLH